MGYTKYVEFMRILRIKAHEVMGDTAKLLNARLPFVSAVENGKRNVPAEWVPILIEHYQTYKVFINQEGEKAFLTTAILPVPPASTGISAGTRSV